MQVWTRQGVIRVSGAGDSASYTIVKTLEEATAGAGDRAGGDDGEGNEADEDDEDDGMRVYEKYITGMLQNFDALPLDRIHNMLKMFVSDDTACTCVGGARR